MEKFVIKVKSVNDPKVIAAVSERQNFEVDIVHGRYVIDAKSIMGIFSLDLSKPLDVVVHAETEEAMRYVDELRCHHIEVIEN